MRAKYGFPTASALYNSYYDAIDTIEKLVAEDGIDCDFARTGKLNLAAKPSHLEGLRKVHARSTRCWRSGSASRRRPRPGASWGQRIGSDFYHGALVDPRGCGLHVGKFTRGLGEVAARRSTRRRRWTRCAGWAAPSVSWRRRGAR